MGRADDDEALRRRGGGSGGRPRSRPPAPTSIASMYAPVESSNRQSQPPQRSAKMKMASLMAVVDADPDESKKSKRVKVDQDDAWTSRNAPLSISSLTAAAETDDHPPAPPSSLFQNEMPPMIQSFSEEKRREAATANGERKNGSALANGDASPAATRSMFDFYFPSGRAEANGNATSSAGRSLKRKRRSARRGDELAATEVDLLRFGVDASKLVPQGLVDRVDVHMSRAVLLKVVGNHVANWCNRSGFASSFLQELTTLLAAYYPCNYPTLLDEVLAGFLFKRPEFIDLVLPAMLEKMSKAGESVSTTKYPVADALVRMCGSSAARMGPQAVARHDLACRSLLRCLVEHNGDRFVLSPWIAACAIESSDNVLFTLWRALLPRTLVAEDKVLPDEENLHWRIENQSQQIVEMLAEESKLRVCRITCGFVRLLLTDDRLKKRLVGSQSYLVSDCLEQAFKYASTSWSSSLLTEWLERRRKDQSAGVDSADSFKDLVNFLVRFNSKLSVKQPGWFVKHVLSFVLSPQCQVEEQEPTLRAILRDYMPLVFGGVDDQSLEQKGRQNGSTESSAAHVGVNDLDVVGSQSVLEVRIKIEQLVSLLVAVSARTSALFLEIWSEAWSEKRTTLSWGYVHALLYVIIQDIIEDRSEVGQKLQSFTTRVCRSYFHRLCRHLLQDNTYDDISTKLSEALNLLLPSTRPIAGVLLQEILGALADLEQKNSADACAIFGNAITLRLGRCGKGGQGNNMKRTIVQKSLVEYDRPSANPTADSTPPSSLATSAQLLATLKTLASTQNDIGDFTRRVLSTWPVMRLLAGLLNFGRRRRRQELLLDVMNAVVTSNMASAKLNREWARHYVVQELVHCAYTGPLSSARKAFALLQNIFRHSTTGSRALLWVVLQQCTKLCCGREDKSDYDYKALSDNYQGRADTFAELVKTMVIAVPPSTMREVLSFVEQKLASCSVGKTRMNLFLLLLLRKLIVCELQCGFILPVVQLAVCPLVSSNLDQIRLIQLQLLKALCTKLTAVRHRSVMVRHLDTDTNWKRCEELVCNERLQSDLRSMVKVAPLPSGGMYSTVERTNRASEVLAQGILAFARQLKQQASIDDDDGGRRILKKGRLK